MSLTSISEVTSDKSDDDSFDWTDEGEHFADDKKVVGSNALSWFSGNHPNAERGEHLLEVASGLNLNAEDILSIFLILSSLSSSFPYISSHSSCEG